MTDLERVTRERDKLAIWLEFIEARIPTRLTEDASAEDWLDWARQVVRDEEKIGGVI